MPCIIEGCERDTFSRGLCQSHYQSARNSIQKGETTWEQLVELGMAKASMLKEQIQLKQKEKARAINQERNFDADEFAKESCKTITESLVEEFASDGFKVSIDLENEEDLHKLEAIIRESLKSLHLNG